MFRSDVFHFLSGARKQVLLHLLLLANELFVFLGEAMHGLSVAVDNILVNSLVDVVLQVDGVNEVLVVQLRLTLFSF